jgi:hypothetical protein
MRSTLAFLRRNRGLLALLCMFVFCGPFADRNVAFTGLMQPAIRTGDRPQRPRLALHRFRAAPGDR